MKPECNIYPDGTQEWCLNGKFHRGDGPAIICPNGTQYWYLNDKLHREDGPAVIYSDGRQEWYLNGSLHREDGPAVIRSDGTQEWWMNNSLHREDGPAVIRPYGPTEWYFNGKPHREDGPAYTCDTTKIYANHGYFHNTHGPAVICKYHAFHTKYFLYGYMISKNEHEIITEEYAFESDDFLKLHIIMLYKDKKRFLVDDYFFG